MRVYGVREMEYRKMRVFCDIVNSLVAEKRRKYFYLELKNTYVDFGQDWKYTCPITEDANERTWQSLSFRDYKALLDCDSFSRIEEFAKMYVEHLLDDVEVDFTK